MDGSLSPQDLTDIINQLHGKYEEKIDYSLYRYAIYCRKSTDDSEKQQRSLPDQLAECEELAKKLGLNVSENDKYLESESAKTPDIRPTFNTFRSYAFASR